MFRVNFIRKRLLASIVLCFVVILVYLVYKSGSHSKRVLVINNVNKLDSGEKSCFESISSKIWGEIILFQDIFDADIVPIKDESIFFIETSCIENKLGALNAR